MKDTPPDRQTLKTQTKSSRGWGLFYTPRPHQSPMALLRDQEKLRIQVLEDSPDSAVFVVQIRCHDPVLLAYWLRKTFFHNGQVQQTDALPRKEGDGLEFVLRVLHRSRRLSNAHYWSPFILALCMDALLFRYRLPQHQQWNGNLEQVMKDNTLTLTRSEEDENRPSRKSTLALGGGLEND